MPPLSIAIIGAGPAGTLLGRLLHQATIPCTIFEAESSPNFRAQGGTLDLHTHTGIAALKAANLYTEFAKHVRYDGEAMCVGDKDARMLLHMPRTKDERSSRGRPEIDRVKLRQILLDGLPEGMIQWDYRLKVVEEDGTLCFENGFRKQFDFVVGADGAWSKVRHFMDPEGWKPMYAGLSGYCFQIHDPENTAPEVYQRVDRGSCFCFSDGKSIMGQQLGDGSISVGTWRKKDEHWAQTAGVDTTDGDLARKITLEEFPDWTPVLRQMVEKSSGRVDYRNLYMLPVGYRFQHKIGFTLVGDAAHLMTPFAGEGVNLAFSDCMKLAEAIITAIKATEPGETLDSNILAYEKDMFYRANRAQVMTAGKMKDMYFTEGAPRKTIESWAMRSVRYHIHPYALPVLYPFLACMVYGYFFYVKLRN